ncbi:hypothetical protein ACO0LF_03275 [Undibacterium sp. Di27W]|uniref:hypothetical protein n=1 Tax=Undibacterium sp. Di27W TaxID=3413036 RepID=UPI003BF3E2E4
MSNRFSHLLLGFVILGLSTPAFAADDSTALTVSGFGTLGLVHSDTRDVDIVRDLTQNSGVGFSRQTDFGMDSNFGVQINKRLNDNVDTAVQIVSRRSANNFQPDVTWAYARYLPNDNLQLRAGRLGFDVYLLADSRNVGYSYQWVRPPIDFFGSLIISYFDGADMVVSKQLGGGILRSKVFAGVAREKTSTGNPDEFLSLNRSRLLGGHLEYQTQNWIYRIGYTELKFRNEFPPLQSLLDNLRSPFLNAFIPTAAGLARDVSLEGKKFKYLSAGIAYDQGPLQAQLMLNQLSSESLLFPTNKAAYLTVGYRIDQWTPYFTYSASRPVGHKMPDRLPPGISPEIDMLRAGINEAIDNQFNHQTTISLGLRYDLTEKSNIKLQYDRINSSDYFLVRNNQPGWNGKANLISIAYNFIF